MIAYGQIEKQNGNRETALRIEGREKIRWIYEIIAFGGQRLS